MDVGLSRRTASEIQVSAVTSIESRHGEVTI